MTRILFVLALGLLLLGCSDSDAPTRKPGEWETFSLAKGRLSFALPTSPSIRTRGESVVGEDPIEEEVASCEYYAEGLGTCFFSVSVVSGPGLPEEMGSTAAERVNWAKLYLVALISGEEGRKIEEEGKWSLGEEKGLWLRLALPANPPKRTIPVYSWIRASTWGDQAVLLQFIGSQAAWNNPDLKPGQDRLRERFFSSLSEK